MNSFEPTTDSSDFLAGYKTYFGNEYMETGKSAQLTPERTRTEIDRLIKLLGLTGKENDFRGGRGRPPRTQNVV